MSLIRISLCGLFAVFFFSSCATDDQSGQQAEQATTAALPPRLVKLDQEMAPQPVPLKGRTIVYVYRTVSFPYDENVDLIANGEKVAELSAGSYTWFYLSSSQLSIELAYPQSGRLESVEIAGEYILGDSFYFRYDSVTEVSENMEVLVGGTQIHAETGEIHQKPVVDLIAKEEFNKFLAEENPNFMRIE